MKRQISFTVTVSALLFGSACGEPDRPLLCVVSPIPPAASGVDSFTREGLGCGDLKHDVEPEEDRRACALDITADGQGYALLHELPDGVSPIGKLQVHIDTPCDGADQDLEVSYVDDVAVLTGVLPPGGRCAFSISATMANSELRCDFVAAADESGQPCTPVCPAGEP